MPYSLGVKALPLCGIGRWHPKCLQRLATIQSFTFFMCIFAVISGMFPMYLVSQITTIEKHFGLPSKRSGMIVSANELGFLISCLIVGHFLNTSHRPRVLACCAFAIATSSILMSVPFFAFGSPHDHGGNRQIRKDEDTGQLCVGSMSAAANATCRGSKYTTTFHHEDEAFGIFILAAIIAGCGSTGIWSIGIAYLDDNSPKKKSPLYIGLMFCLRSLAPVFGLIFGAGVSYISVDLQDKELTPGHSSWIGAWWIGFLGIGIVTFLSGIPLLFFPKRLPVPQDDSTGDKDKAKKAGKNFDDAELIPARQRSQSVVERMAEEGKTLAKSFPVSLWRILRNVVFLLICFGAFFDVASGVGYGAFLPKYIESQFHVTTFTANILTAFVVALTNAIGMGISGVLTSKLKVILNDLFFRSVIVVALTYAVFLLLMAFGCPEIDIKGLTIGNGSLVFDPTDCNSQCQCLTNEFSPVCGIDGHTYFSACSAGCLSGSVGTSFSNCSCIRDAGTAAVGPCSTGCHMLIPFSILLGILTLVTSIAAMPFMMLLLRCVEERDKSLALAVLNIVISLGILPIPVIYGAVVDSLCIVKNQSTTCGGEASDMSTCLFYDASGMRYRLHGLTVGIRIISPIMYLITWYKSRNMVFAGDEKLREEQKLRNLDKHTVSPDELVEMEDAESAEQI